MINSVREISSDREICRSSINYNRDLSRNEKIGSKTSISQNRYISKRQESNSEKMSIVDGKVMT